jgi:hypothetical protein
MSIPLNPVLSAIEKTFIVVGTIIIVPLLLPVFIFGILSALALFIYDKYNKGLGN